MGLLDNAFASRVIGVLVTLFVQSPSVSTCIVITVGAAGLIEMIHAVPMILGAYVGIFVTNALVGMPKMGDKDECRRAVAGGTLQFRYNLLTIGVLVALATALGLLGNMSKVGVTEWPPNRTAVDKLSMPASSRMIQREKFIAKAQNVTAHQEMAEVMKKPLFVQSPAQPIHMCTDKPFDDHVHGWLVFILSVVLLTAFFSFLLKVLQYVFLGRSALFQNFFVMNRVLRANDYVFLIVCGGSAVLMQSIIISISLLASMLGVGNAPVCLRSLLFGVIMNMQERLVVWRTPPQQQWPPVQIPSVADPVVAQPLTRGTCGRHGAAPLRR